MKKFTICFVFGFLLVRSGLSQTPAPASDEMTLDDLRQYFAVMHIKEADARAMQVQMQAQIAKFPAWWPVDVTDAITAGVLSVDLPPLEYPFVKSCMNSADTQALTALFQTPEGQAYVNQVTGAMVQAQAAGTSPADAKQQQMVTDRGIPPAALQHLTADQQDRVRVLLKGNAVQCMNRGLFQANAAVGQTRNDLVKKIMLDHTSELQAAKAKFEGNPGAPKE